MDKQDLILALLSMGFEYDDCKRVLQTGILNVDEAVQRLLAEKNELYTSLKNLEVAAGSSKEVSKQPKDENAKDELSNYQAGIKRQKLEERSERKRILENVEADRQRRRQERGTKKLDTPAAQAKASATINNELPDSNASRIQLRLPSGFTMQYKYDKNCCLQDIYDAVISETLKSSPTVNVTLKQPFPSRIFDHSDLGKSLLELGLFPSGTLVVQNSSGMNEQSNIGLLPIPVEIVDNTDHPDAALINEAVERRIQAATLEENAGYSSHFVERKVDSLQTLSATCIAHYLLKMDQHITMFMSKLSTATANIILSLLMSWRKLTPTILTLFLPCKLTEVRFNYTLSNELVEKLRWHTHIKKLSFKSCPCINDSHVSIALKGIHSLEYLSISDCKQLTGAILVQVSELKNFKTLIISNFEGLKDEHLRNFFCTLQTRCLQHVEVSFCGISSDAFQDFPCFLGDQLKHLCLNRTNVESLTFLEKLSNLMTLKLNMTGVLNNELQYVSKLKQLKCLELHGTNVTNDGLSFLRNLTLTHLKLPNIAMVNNETIKIIKDFPLHFLDLSCGMSVTDSCVEHIRHMNSLQTLSLSNTSITDESIQFLLGLVKIEELDLSRTRLSNSVVGILSKLGQLRSVNLANLPINDTAIREFNICYNLVKLNLSRTFVTNSGIATLNIQRLEVLLLDDTEVTIACAEQCRNNCKSLKLIRNSKNKVNLTR